MCALIYFVKYLQEPFRVVVWEYCTLTNLFTNHVLIVIYRSENTSKRENMRRRMCPITTPARKACNYAILTTFPTRFRDQLTSVYICHSYMLPVKGELRLTAQYATICRPCHDLGCDRRHTVLRTFSHVIFFIAMTGDLLPDVFCPLYMYV